MKSLEAIEASLGKIASLDQQIFRNNIEVLKEIIKNVQAISQLPPLAQKKTFLGHVLSLDHNENKISKILEFFFNPKEVHGYSDLFLTALTECLKNTEWNLNRKNFEKIECEHTFREIGSQSRIDLVLYFKDFVMGIEHKIYANLDNPLKEYLRGLQEIAKEPKREAKLIVFSLRKYSAKELNNCINITYDEFYKALCENKENFQSDHRWRGIFEDFLISMENLIGVDNMSEKQRERQCLIWELFTKNNMKEIIEEFESLKDRFIALQEELAEKYREKIEKFGFEVTEFEFDEDSANHYTLMYTVGFDTKKETELTLCLENYGGGLSVSLLHGCADDITNNDDTVLTIGNDPPYADNTWGDDDTGETYFWRKVRVNGEFLSQRIDSNPYADDFAEKVMAACEAILAPLAKALKYTK